MLRTLPPLLLALVLLLPLIPVASAANNCGASIVPYSHSPADGSTYTTSVKLDLEARFYDEPAHCGAHHWTWLFNGEAWVNLGTAQLEGDLYVMKTQAFFNTEGAWHIVAAIEENCCGPNGEPASSFKEWDIVINWCNDNYVGTISPTGDVSEERPLITVAFEQTDPLCPIEGGQLIVDGIVRDTTLSRSGNTYTLSWTPGSPLIPGTHHIQAQVQQKCCESGAGTPKLNTVEGTFNVLSCGDNRHAVDMARPQGTTGEAQPLIEVVFRDVDRVCGAVNWGMKLDGLDVQPNFEDLGGTIVLRYTPPLPLLPGPHAVSAFVTERCCNAAGAQVRTDEAWSFTTLAAPGTSISRTASIPATSSNTALGGPTYFPGYNDPLVPVGIDGFWIPLPGPAKVQVGVEEIPVGLLVDPAHTADETQIPTPLTTITVCRKGSTPCPAPLVDPTTGSITYTVEVTLAGQTLLRDGRTIPLIP